MTSSNEKTRCPAFQCMDIEFKCPWVTFVRFAGETRNHAGSWPGVVHLPVHIKIDRYPLCYPGLSPAPVTTWSQSRLLDMQHSIDLFSKPSSQRRSRLPDFHLDSLEIAEPWYENQCAKLVILIQFRQPEQRPEITLLCHRLIEGHDGSTINIKNVLAILHRSEMLHMWRDL